MILCHPNKQANLINPPPNVAISSNSHKLLGFRYGYAGLDYKGSFNMRKTATALLVQELRQFGYCITGSNIKLDIEWFNCFVRPTILFGCGVYHPDEFGGKTQAKN